MLIVEKDKTGESCYLQVNSIAMTTDFENEGPPSVYRETKNSIPICLTRGLDSKSTCIWVMRGMMSIYVNVNLWRSICRLLMLLPRRPTALSTRRFL